MDSNHVPPRYLALSAAPTISGNSTLASAAARVMWHPCSTLGRLMSQQAADTNRTAFRIGPASAGQACLKGSAWWTDYLDAIALGDGTENLRARHGQIRRSVVSRCLRTEFKGKMLEASR